MICKKHKTYRGLRPSTTNCRKCKFIFALRRALKFFKLPVAEVRRAPKAEAVKVQEFVKEFCPLPPIRVSGVVDPGAELKPPYAETWLAGEQELAEVQREAVKRNTAFHQELKAEAAKKFLFIGGPWHGELRNPGPAVWDARNPNFVQPLTVDGVQYELLDVTGSAGTTHRAYVAYGTEPQFARDCVLEFEATGTCATNPVTPTYAAAWSAAGYKLVGIQREAFKRECEHHVKDAAPKLTPELATRSSH